MIKRLKGIITLLLLAAAAVIALAWFTGYLSFGSADPPKPDLPATGKINHHIPPQAHT